ncbi:MAG: Tryptophan-rich protein TspO [Stenotrophomonas maltophilia]|uniref:Tryptophan-rich protein TspO n=1 Tax=Stenotrophomonas maltophilia TaxID=40324 RepID=A0A7V8JLY3_STEMA|nr:MAG: Tryptophan-rich protein TspO [Stenotrophomonas maltophilia]
MNHRRQMTGLLGWLLLTLLAAALGARASVQAASFYQQLAQPAWAPPASVFGPVWSALFLMMALAAWLVWRQGGWARQRTALVLYVVQLAANTLWSWLFFGWKLGGPAFADIVLLWLLIVSTLVAFWRVRPLAGALLLPYLGWVTFAAALNHAVWQANPAALGCASSPRTHMKVSPC